MYTGHIYIYIIYKFNLAAVFTRALKVDLYVRVKRAHDMTEKSSLLHGRSWFGLATLYDMLAPIRHFSGSRTNLRSDSLGRCRRV